MPSGPQYQVKRPLSTALAARHLPLPVVTGHGSFAVGSVVLVPVFALGTGD